MPQKYKRLILTLICFVLVALTVVSSEVTQKETTTSSQASTPAPTPSIIPTASASAENTSQTYLVTRVIDGDTIEIEGGQKIRYIGIDTPESTIQKECFGKEAATRNSELILGQRVRLEKDVSETDRYGRLLRYVYVDDIFINATLVKEGFAQARSYPPDIAKQEVFRVAELEARTAKKGLWGTICNK